MSNRTAQLFRTTSVLAQAPEDVVSLESNSEMSLEESQASVEAIESEIASCEQRASTLDDVAAALSDIALSMESTLQAGGMYPQTAWYANLAIESQLARVGLDDGPVISVEDVGGALTRIEGTQKSMDGLKEKLKKLWDALVEMVHRVWDSVIAFLRNFFTATGRLRDRARRLGENARGATVINAVGDKFDIGALVKNISVEGKTEYPFAEAATSLSKTLHELAERSIARGKEQSAALSALLHRQATALFDQGMMYHVHPGKFTPPPQFKVIEDSVHVSAHGVQNAVSYESPVFPGERILKITVAKVDLGDARYYADHPEQWARDVNRGIGTDQYRIVREPSEHEPSSEIRMLSLREIEDLAHAVVNAADTFEHFTRNASSLQSKARADLQAVANRVGSEQGLRVFSGHGVVFGVLLNAYGRVARQLLLPSTVLCGLVLSICGDFVKVGELAMKEYEPA